MTIPYIPSRDIHLHHRILPFPFLLLITSTTTTIYYYYTPYSILVHSILPLRCVALSLPHPVLEPAQRACCDLSESNRVGKKDRIRQTKIDLVSSIKPSLRLSSFFFFFGRDPFPHLYQSFIPNQPIACLFASNQIAVVRAISYIILPQALQLEDASRVSLNANCGSFVS